MPLKLIEQSLYTQKEKEKKYQITVPYGKYPFLENKYLAIFDCYKLLRQSKSFLSFQNILSCSALFSSSTVNSYLILS